MLSSTFLILIFSFWCAATIEAIRFGTTVPKGISVIASRVGERTSIFARTRTLPPRRPSL